MGELASDIRNMGAARAFEKRKMWNEMRMNPTDLADVSGAAFTYLVNGQTPAANWTALARPGEKVRLRIINAAATTIFDIRIPGMKMTVVSADGQDVSPVSVDEIRISVAETYDVIVEMPEDRAYTIFAQSIDRSGYARATIAPHAGMTAPVPEMDPKTWLTMADMGMSDMAEHGAGHSTSVAPAAPIPPAMAHQAVSNTSGGATKSDEGTTLVHGQALAAHGVQQSGAAASFPRSGGHIGHNASNAADTVPPAAAPSNGAGVEGMEGLSTERGVDARVMSPSKSLSDPGPRLRDNGRRVLTYADLYTIGGPLDERPPDRTIVLRLTGNMRRFVWGFDGKKFSEQGKIYFKYGERLRVTLINDTMMNHPIHLHGMFSEVESEDGKFQVRKHTINVQPSKQISFLVTVDAPGQWALHCHLLYHMEAGMFRTVVVV
jgi:CopA family copper-resistance protein